MRPQRVFFGTFDAERWWDDSAEGRFPALAPGPAASALASADELLALLCAPGDELLTSLQLPAELLDQLGVYGVRVSARAVPGSADIPVEHRIAESEAATGEGFQRAPAPYAVIGPTRAACLAIDPLAEVPEVGSVQIANSKIWANAFCADRAIVGAAALVRTASELDRALARVNCPVVVKSAHGVAGRGSLIIKDRRMLGAIRQRLAEKQDEVGLLVQKFYEREADFSAHFDISADGVITPAQFCALTCRGLAFRSSGTLDPKVEERLSGDPGYLATLTELGQELAAIGYYGPVCVDGLIAADGTLVPVLDVNARYSMGRITLALAERCRRAPSLTVAFFQLAISTPADEAYKRINSVAAAAGLLWDGVGAGITILTAGTLQQPIGRCYYAAHGRSPDEIHAMERRLRAELGEHGFTIFGPA